MCTTHHHQKTRAYCVGESLPALPGCKEKIWGYVGRGGKGSQGRRLRLGIWYMLPFIFSLVFLPQTESREKGRLAQTQTHTQRYFLLGVRGGQTVLWMTAWALKWAPFSSCSAPAFSSSPSTIVQLCLVALTLGCLWFQRIYAHQGIIILNSD